MGIFSKLFNKAPKTETAATVLQQTTAGNILDQQNQANLTPNITPDTAKSLARAAEHATETEQQRLARQGDKLIAMYFRGPNVLKEASVEVSDDERNAFLDRLTSVNEDAITPVMQSQLLQEIALPSGKKGQENYPKVFDRINHRHGLTILRFAGNYQADGSQLDANFLQDFLGKYPTPIEFEPRAQALIERLQENNVHPLKISQYEDDLITFQKDVYGKRYQYNQALKELQEQAYSRARTRGSAEVAAQQAIDHENLSKPVDTERIQAAWSDPSYVSPEGQSLVQSDSPSSASPQAPNLIYQNEVDEYDPSQQYPL